MFNVNVSFFWLWKSKQAEAWVPNSLEPWLLTAIDVNDANVLAFFNELYGKKYDTKIFLIYLKKDGHFFVTWTWVRVGRSR